MSDPIVDAVKKHPAPEGLVYTYGTAGVCIFHRVANTRMLMDVNSSEPKRNLSPSHLDVPPPLPNLG